MKTILIFAFLISFSLGQRLDFDDPKCNNYVQKFETTNNPNGTAAIKMAFTGDVFFIRETSNVEVNLRYSDVEFFNDATLFGLVQEDGKTAAETCLDLKLWKFTSNTYGDPVQVKDLTITPSNNFSKQWRYYSFTIPGAELGTRLVQTSNSAQFIYKGYYAIAYYAADTEEVKYTFYFEFSVTVYGATSTLVETSFKSLNYAPINDCPLNSYICCPISDTVLKWCTDMTCMQKLTPDLHQNDQIVLQQIVKLINLSDYYLIDTEVFFTGNGLNKQVRPVQVINTIKGQVTIVLKAAIVWRQVIIKVTSYLSTTQAGERILVHNQFSVSGQTGEIECIKAEGSETCPTCDEELDANGYSSESCPSSFSKQIGFIFLTLLLAFTI